MFKKILHPTDFSPVAIQAFEQAVSLAQRFGAEVQVVHALVLHGYDPALIRKGLPLLEKAYEAIESELVPTMNELAGKAKEIQINTVFQRGFSPWNAILNQAEEYKPDLIVMGAHGAAPVRQFFLGSVAEKVVRNAPCPVMILRKGQQRISAYRRILLPVDFSEASKPAMECAINLARHDGAEVALLHVFQEVMPPSFYAAGGAFQWDPDLKDRCKASMNDLLSDYPLEGLRIKKLVREGKTCKTIVDVAEEEEVDLIVMGTHGLSGLPHIFLGSVAERVLRRADCPVLTVRGKKI